MLILLDDVYSQFPRIILLIGYSHVLLIHVNPRELSNKVESDINQMWPLFRI